MYFRSQVSMGGWQNPGSTVKKTMIPPPNQMWGFEKSAQIPAPLLCVLLCIPLKMVALRSLRSLSPEGWKCLGAHIPWCRHGHYITVWSLTTQLLFPLIKIDSEMSLHSAVSCRIRLKLPRGLCVKVALPSQFAGSLGRVSLLLSSFLVNMMKSTVTEWSPAEVQSAAC